MRPIDADALWTKIHGDGGCGAKPDTWDDGWDKAINVALDHVEAAPTITPNLHWISVDEQLPQYDGYVLVYLQRKCGYLTHEADVVYWHGGWAVRWPDATYITHWMPLPELPKARVSEGGKDNETD